MGALCAVSAALLSSREGREAVAGALTGGGFTRGAPDDRRDIGAGVAVAAAVVAALRLGALGMSTAALARKLGQPTPPSLFRQLARRDPCPPSGPAAPLLDMPASCAQGSLRQVLAAAVLALLLCRGSDEQDGGGGSAGSSGIGNASAAACLMLVLGLPTLSALTLCVCAAESSAAPAAQADTRALRGYVAAQLMACLEGAAVGPEGAGHSPSPRASPVKAAAATSGPPPVEHLPLPAPVLMQLRALLLPLLGRDVSVSGEFFAEQGSRNQGIFLTCHLLLILLQSAWARGRRRRGGPPRRRDPLLRPWRRRRPSARPGGAGAHRPGGLKGPKPASLCEL